MPKELNLEPVDWNELGPCVIGVDEVGRGCLAGPVYAAAVLFRQGETPLEVTDSKKLSEARRNQAAALIHAERLVCVAEASVDEIDQINILQASLLAMWRAVEGLRAKLPASEQESSFSWPVVVDGHMKIPRLDLRQPQVTLVKGDLRCAPVSAASIVAKVARDNLMKESATGFPGYGFEVHKGYLTPTHKQALASLGPCELHRKTFAGVKELLVRTTEP